MLEFDEFLKIGGCTQGRHLFAPKSNASAVRIIRLLPRSTDYARTGYASTNQLQSQAEEFADCRIDHYQTPTNVNVSVFARQVDKERSTIVFESEMVLLVHDAGQAN